ncbi:MAG: hypothetical protein AAB222_04455 [Candidatus Binatota bacterium]|mgnify:CR=1 FL=1
MAQYGFFFDQSRPTEIHAGLSVGRDRLVLKAKTVEELMTATRDDE